MRGNWDAAEPLVHAPNQQRQQQQQTIVEDQQHPHHSSTTPVWGITDRIMKEEPTEDKNNDSGVSPDHYTSNSASSSSRRSSSPANCSLSPGSGTSQDSSNMQCTAFDYTVQAMFKSSALPLEFAQHQSVEGHQADQAMEVVSSMVKPPNENAELGQGSLQCPICAFTPANRLKFTEHLATHCATKCTSQGFVKTVLDHLATPAPIPEESQLSPGQGERSEHDSEETDEPGLRVPRVNSQGKVKTFRCKQCNFVAITKLEFWEHSRGHIKAEKLLTCPKCPFVTEYKHHLEYHLRNHFGSKPFKCDKCAYSCVNKSMLNSHLKSHSNIYQYRCANCSYATKYCHSLKLHLRKYAHQPAMVLNTDGSPNPFPIIDIYGTRRGPKQKFLKSEDESQSSSYGTSNNLPNPLPSSQLVVAPQISPVGHHLPLNPLNGMSPANGMNGMMPGPSVIAFPYNRIFTSFPLAHYPVAEDSSVGKQLERIKSNALMGYMKAIDGEKVLENMPQDLVIRCIKGSVPSGVPNEPTNSVLPKTNEASTSTVWENCEQSVDATATPLDLSKPGGSVQNKPGTNSPKASGTSRRKGKAVKLERRVVEEDIDEEQLLKQERQQNPVTEQQDSFEPGVESRAGSSNECKSDESDEFNCPFCDIAFGNVVMYTVHMGYHGYKNPFTCNMCGDECTDKVSFFLHIARSKHS